MNTKWVLTASALFLAVIGIGLTFLPKEIAGLMGLESIKFFPLVLQLAGSLYFSFAMINWMAKGSIIGGIYNKPIALGNFTHFFIGALALLKFWMNVGGLPQSVEILTVLYALFAILFGLIVFKHPAGNS